MLDTLPLVVAAFPFGVVYGALAQSIDLSLPITLGMSLIVFGGASQFIAVSLLASAAAFPIIVITIFIVNLRHMLYSANLMSVAEKWPLRWRVPLSFWLTDETFAAVSSRAQKFPEMPGLRWFYLGSALFMYSFWQFATLVGFVLAGNLPQLADWGLDVAMIVAFIGIVVPLLKSYSQWLCAATAFFTAIVCHDWPHQTGLLFSALIALLVGVTVRRCSS